MVSVQEGDQGVVLEEVGLRAEEIEVQTVAEVQAEAEEGAEGGWAGLFLLGVAREEHRGQSPLRLNHSY